MDWESGDGGVVRGTAPSGHGLVWALAKSTYPVAERAMAGL